MTIARLEELAASQLGVFSWEQALGNVTEAAIEYHGAPGGRWKRVLPRVYVVRSMGSDWRQRFLAAQFWGGPGAVLSHDSAGSLLSLDGVDCRSVHVRLARSTRSPAGWMILQRRPVHPHRVTVTADGLLRHTDSLLTLADLVGTLDEVKLEWALESLLRKRLASLADVTELAAGRGIGALRRVLAVRGVGVPPTGSVLETRFVQAAREVEVPPLERQVPIELGVGFGRVYVDLAWPDLGLFVEIDGRWHDDEEVKPYDRNRQNEIIIAKGWRPLRFGSADIRRRPRYCARRLEVAYRRATSGAWEPTG